MRLICTEHLRKEDAISQKNAAFQTEHINLHQTAKIVELIDEIKELADIVCNAWTVRVLSLQMLLIDLADTYNIKKWVVQQESSVHTSILVVSKDKVSQS